MHYEVPVTSSVFLTETDGSIGVTIEEDGTLHRVPSVVPVRTDRVFAFPTLAGILHLADLKTDQAGAHRRTGNGTLLLPELREVVLPVPMMVPLSILT